MKKIFHELGEDVDLQDINIDSIYIKTHKASAGLSHGVERGLSKPIDEKIPISKEAVCEDKTKINQCIRVSCGGRSTRIHAVVDALGNLIELMLTAGNVHDVVVVEKLLSWVPLKGTTILADKTSGKWTLREFITNHDADYCIPQG